MQRFTTPLPGRTNSKLIRDQEDYKLDVELQEFRPDEYMLSIRRWIPETGWADMRLFLTPEELKQFRNKIG